ncbi:MAG: glutamine amidotransferase [Microbacteriaceae bacterium]|jgi:CobQ-like glutamine amidotransferase family enzyme|nr:glutamine amidotransferase [Microbacteriaceae bacterium]MCI1207460.1 glutamine amidotransferase [Microbacteriaceae bacterium]
MSTERELHILHLYPVEMSTYGDTGNILALVSRARAHGFVPRVDRLTADCTELPEQVDVVVGGGGQDSGQLRIEAALGRLADRFRALTEDGAPMLLICGMYQLFGNSYVTGEGTTMRGIGVLDVDTKAGVGRRSDDICVDSPEFGRLLGYENHSGITVLGEGTPALGTVVYGSGNGSEDGTEGARFHNLIGTYIHGPILPKNPAVTDWLIRTAAQRRYGVLPDPVPVPEYTEGARAQAWEQLVRAHPEFRMNRH